MFENAVFSRVLSLFERLILFALSCLLFCPVSLVRADNLPVDASQDGGASSQPRGYVWYEQGFNTNAPTTGLPAAGTIFESVSLPDHRYVLFCVITERITLYSYDFALTNLFNPVLAIEVSVERSFGQIAHTAVFAVSGSTGGRFEPVSLEGFTRDLAIEADYSGFQRPNLSAISQTVVPEAALSGETYIRAVCAIGCVGAGPGYIKCFSTCSAATYVSQALSTATCYAGGE